jgi:hypothetical protein
MTGTSELLPNRDKYGYYYFDDRKASDMIADNVSGVVKRIPDLRPEY